VLLVLVAGAVLWVIVAAAIVPAPIARRSAAPSGGLHFGQRSEDALDEAKRDVADYRPAEVDGDRLAAVADALLEAAVPAVDLVAVTGELWEAQSTFTKAMSEAYRAEATARALTERAAAAAPDVTGRVASTLMAPLDSMREPDRRILIETLDAWLQHGGSADATARALFCHPNTVRLRLRRIEERTGRSLSDPRDTAELCLAIEVLRQEPTSDRSGDAAET
jgi:hypothetical protein